MVVLSQVVSSNVQVSGPAEALDVLVEDFRTAPCVDGVLVSAAWADVATVLASSGFDVEVR